MRPTLYVLLGVLLVPTVGLVGDIVTDGKFTSTMSTGAPLEVASDDMVVNLNADMVDGIEGTDIYTKAEVDALVAAAADSRRWFYLTTAYHSGGAADTACDSGFHMASFYEILDPSNLRYDTGRGEVSDDSGQGPPQGVVGWIRTGYLSYEDQHPGRSNCLAWTSWSASDYGTTAWLDHQQLFDSTSTVNPWVYTAYGCSSTAVRVWCVED
jgi:hypothetical protein